MAMIAKQHILDIEADILTSNRTNGNSSGGVNVPLTHPPEPITGRARPQFIRAGVFKVGVAT